MTRALLLVAVVGCAADATLPSDAYFIGTPYSYVESPNAELALCRDGRAALWTGLRAREGSYHLEDQLAVAQVDVFAFQFDVGTSTAPGADLGAYTWTPDTTQQWQKPPFADIACK